VLGRIFGPKREEMAGSWRRLLNEELHHLYSSPDMMIIIMEEDVMCMTIACMGNEKAYSIFVGKLQGKRSLGRPRNIWENIIKMDLGYYRCFCAFIQENGAALLDTVCFSGDSLNICCSMYCTLDIHWNFPSFLLTYITLIK